MLRHLDVADGLFAGVSAEECDLDAVFAHAGLREDRSERRARPARRADAAEEPGEAMIARAFQPEIDLLPGPRLDLGQGEGAGTLDQAADLQGPGLVVDDRPIVVRHAEELLVGRDPGAEVLPFQLVRDHLRDRILRRLIHPGQDFLARPARKGLSEARGLQNGQARERGAALNDKVPAWKIRHDGLPDSSVAGLKAAAPYSPRPWPASGAIPYLGAATSPSRAMKPRSTATDAACTRDSTASFASTAETW